MVLLLEQALGIRDKAPVSGRPPLFGTGFRLLFWPLVGGMGLASLAMAAWVGWTLCHGRYDLLPRPRASLAAPLVGLGAALWAAAATKWALDRYARLDLHTPPEEAAAAREALRGRPRRMLATVGLLVIVLGPVDYALANRLLFPARLEKTRAALKTAATALILNPDYSPLPTLTSDGRLYITLWQIPEIALESKGGMASVGVRKADLESTEGHGSWPMEKGGIHGGMRSIRRAWEKCLCFELYCPSFPSYVRECELTVDWEITAEVPGGIGLPSVPVSEFKRTKTPVRLGPPLQ